MAAPLILSGSPFAREVVTLSGNTYPSDVIGWAVRAFYESLSDDGLPVLRQSPLYRTPCFPAGAGPDYVNAAARLAGGHTPQEVLQILHRIEARHGRKRLQRWGGRTLDLDLLAAGDTVLPDAATQAAWRDLPAERQARDVPDRLILPHPRIQDRAFVLVPLCDVAPDWIHPLTGQTVAQMSAALSAADRAAVRPLQPDPANSGL